MTYRFRSPFVGTLVLAVAFEVMSVGQEAEHDSAVSPVTNAKAGKRMPGRHVARIPALPIEFELAKPSPVEQSRARRPDRLGFHRLLSSEVVDKGGWEFDTIGQRQWRLKIKSPGAVGIRLHFVAFSLSPGESVMVYSTVEDRAGYLQWGPFTGQGPWEQSEFWTPILKGESAIVEFSAPPGSAKVRPPFRIDRLSHIESLPTLGGGLQSGSIPGGAGWCNPSQLSPVCAGWSFEASGVALLEFETDSGSYSCTGSLLNSRGASFRPYLVTAHHCIPTQSEALSLQAYFYFQESTCNGTEDTRYSFWYPDVFGSQYLAGAALDSGDFTLVYLLGDAPPSLTYLGWSTAAPDFDAKLLTIHHPRGDHKRFAIGKRVADASAAVTDDSGNIVIEPKDLFFRGEFTPFPSGVTQHGSSGAPIFNDSRRVVAFDSIGPDDQKDADKICSLKTATIGGGRFSQAYTQIRTYLEDKDLPESNHNYLDQFDFTWIYAIPNATASGVKLSFDPRTNFEDGYDFIWISDSYGNPIPGSPFTGAQLAGQDVFVPDSTVQLHLNSDYSVNKWGFKVTSAQPSGPDLNLTSLTATTRTASVGGSLPDMRMTIQNAGDRDSGSFEVRFYLSTDSIITTADFYTGWGCQWDRLNAGQSVACGGKIGIPSNLAPGRYYLGAIVDPLNEVLEKKTTKSWLADSAGPITVTK